MIKIKSGTLSESRQIGKVSSYYNKEDTLEQTGDTTLSLTIELSYDTESMSRTLVSDLRKAFHAVVDRAAEDAIPTEREKAVP